MFMEILFGVHAQVSYITYLITLLYYYYYYFSFQIPAYYVLAFLLSAFFSSGSLKPPWVPRRVW